MDDYKDEKYMFSECEGAYDDYDTRGSRFRTSAILSEKLIFNKAAVDAGSRIIRSLELEKEQNRRDFEKLQKKHLRDKKVLMAEIDRVKVENQELRSRIKPDKKRSVWNRMSSSRDEPSGRSYWDEQSRNSSRDQPSSRRRTHRDDIRSSRSRRDEPRAQRDAYRDYREESPSSSRSERDEPSSRHRDEPSSRYDEQSGSSRSVGSGSRSGRKRGSYREEPSSRSRSCRDDSPHEHRKASQNQDSRYRSYDHSPGDRVYGYSDRRKASNSKGDRQQPRQNDYDDEF